MRANDTPRIPISVLTEIRSETIRMLLEEIGYLRLEVDQARRQKDIWQNRAQALGHKDSSDAVAYMPIE